MKETMPGKRRTLPVYHMTLGALYVAFFPLVTRVIPPIMLIPGVPVTLQNFLILMMGLTLGVRGGMASLGTVLLLTFIGLPMMTQGGGPGVIVGPTGGYILGFVFIVLLTGLYSSLLMDRLAGRKLVGVSLHVPISFAVGMAGILLQYACGVTVTILITGQSWAVFPGLMAGNIAAFIWGDMVKAGMASAASLLLFARPAFRQLLAARRGRAA